MVFNFKLGGGLPQTRSGGLFGMGRQMSGNTGFNPNGGTGPLGSGTLGMRPMAGQRQTSNQGGPTLGTMRQGAADDDYYAQMDAWNREQQGKSPAVGQLQGGTKLPPNVQSIFKLFGQGSGMAANHYGNLANMDPMERAAREQSGMGQQAVDRQTQANHPDQSNQGGYSKWVQDPATGKWTQETGLHPELAALFGNLTREMNGGGQGAADAAYKQMTSRLDPMFAQRESSMRTQLLNQGLSEDSDAYKRQMASFGQGRNDAYQTAMNASQDQGMKFRTNTMDAMKGLFGFQQMPGFNAAGAAPPPDLLRALEAKMGVQRADADRGSAELAAIIGAGGAVAGAGLPLLLGAFGGGGGGGTTNNYYPGGGGMTPASGGYFNPGPLPPGWAGTA